MRRWVRKWEITISWDHARNSPHGTSRYHTQADTVGELQRLVEAARADPHVTSLPHRTVRVLVGEPPTHCRRGHPYHGGSANTPKQDWTECACGGHLLLGCRWLGCDDVLPDPEPGPDCG